MITTRLAVIILYIYFYLEFPLSRERQSSVVNWEIPAFAGNGVERTTNSDSGEGRNLPNISNRLSFPRNLVIPAKPCHSGESLSFRRKPVIPAKACHSGESLSFRRKPEQVLFIPFNPADYIFRFCTIMHNCH
jgi:hypothetical protein